MAQIDKSLLVEEESLMVPVLPLRDVVVFPYMVIPLFVGRAKSIRALEEAMSGEKQILLVSQKNAADDDPQPENIYRIGTLATILQLLKLPDGTVKVLVEGTDRAKIVSFLPADESLRAQVQVVVSGAANDRELEALMRSVSAQFESYVKLNKKYRQKFCLPWPVWMIRRDWRIRWLPISVSSWKKNRIFSKK